MSEVKTIGSKAWKIITSIWKAFVQPGKINLKPFEIVIDVLVGVFVPSLSSAPKLLTYKAFNKKLVQIAFKNAGKSFINITISNIWNYFNNCRLQKEK